MAGLALIVALIVAYAPSLRGGFVWDDDDHVVNNMTLRSLSGLARIWTQPGAVPQYYPLVHTTFWIEYHLWGLHPFGYHFVNVLIHGIASLLFLGLLRRLAVPGAWIGAGLFAFHPVAVESVAWITERKNVLSLLFYLLALRAYLRFAPPGSVGRGSRREYVAALVLFLCALLSKTVTATLPAAILLITWWKRGRLGRRDFVLLVPFLAAGLALSAVTVWMERHHVGAKGEAWDLSLLDRSIVAGRALFFYASKLLIPARLTFIYPRWTLSPIQLFFPIAALAGIAVLLALRWRIGRGPAAAILFFAGTLAPALGFFDVYPMRYSFVADHFQYHASLGPIALAAATLARIRAPARRWVAGFLLLALGLLTLQRASAYRDIASLWRDTIRKNPECWMAHHNLGLYLEREGRIDEAVERYREALRIRPDLEQSHYNLATALASEGKLEEARGEFEAAIRLRPGYVEAWNNLGNILQRMGRDGAAIESYRRAIASDPSYLSARKNLAYTLGGLGRARESITEYRAAARLSPDDPSVLRDLAWLLATAPDPADRDPGEAVRLAERACSRAGGADAPCLNALAAAYAASGRFQEAVAAIERAITAAGAGDRSDLIPQMRILLARYRAAASGSSGR